MSKIKRLLIASLVFSLVLTFSLPCIGQAVTKSFRITNESGTIKVYDESNQVAYSGTDASTVINWALANLTSGRTVKERVTIDQGTFTINSPIIIYSYTILEIKGVLQLGGIDYDLINVYDQSSIEIIGNGGELAGRGKTHGTTGWGIRTLSNWTGGRNENILVKGLYIHDFRMSAVAVGYCFVSCIVENCICTDNGFNGIGFGDCFDYVVARNNTCTGNSDGGINLEDVWDFELVDNICNYNTRHNLQLEQGVRGKIIRGQYNYSTEYNGIQIRNRAKEGRQHEMSNDVDVRDVVAIGNAKHGLLIQCSYDIRVTGGKFLDNGQVSGNGIHISDDGVNRSYYNSIKGAVCEDSQSNKTQDYGIRESSGDYNTITNNDCRSNKTGAISYVGAHTTSSGNYTTGSYTNYTLRSQGCTASCSSYYAGYTSYVASYANDGDFNTRWTASTGSHPQWWKVDLGQSYNLGKVDIWWFNNENPRYYGYKIEVSSDDQTYTVAVDKSNNTTKEFTADIFDNSSVRYVKITVTGCSYSGGKASIYECRVFSK